ncbi:MAG: type II toxin-antitoxin system RelE/ParE family toxin [Methylococcaceae bacterium]|nr:MAG: type II toxin-antitoxin system RelE/ParE family toxin [Methylococcaceae bacterium]
MAWTIEFSPRARDDFAKIDQAMQRRIVKFLRRLEYDPRRYGAALQGGALGNYWKYRIGDYRVIADIRDSRLNLLVVKIGHRSDVYR